MTFAQHLRQRRLYKNALKMRQDRKTTESLAAVDRLIEIFGKKIPYLTRCRGQMAPLVYRSGRYLDRLVNLIPGPVVLDPDRWDRDPAIYSICESEKRLCELIASSASLQQFFRAAEKNAALALLTAEKKEKTVFVTEKDGEIFLRDVLKKAIYFEGHQIIAPGETFGEIRRQVRFQLLSDFFGMFAEKIAERNELRAQLEAQHNEATAKMALYADESDQKKQFNALLGTIDEKIKSMGKQLNSPTDYWTDLQDLLGNPQRQVSARLVSLKLNPMGILLSNASAEKANEFSLAEFMLKNGKKWVATWISVDRGAFQRCSHHARRPNG